MFTLILLCIVVLESVALAAMIRKHMIDTQAWNKLLHDEVLKVRGALATEMLTLRNALRTHFAGSDAKFATATITPIPTPKSPLTSLLLLAGACFMLSGCEHIGDDQRMGVLVLAGIYLLFVLALSRGIAATHRRHRGRNPHASTHLVLTATPVE